MTTPPLLDVDTVSLTYGKNTVVRDISFSVEASDRVGLIGESGSGKTSIARAVLGLLPVADGEIRFQGTPIHSLTRRQRTDYRGAIQPVFQDGTESLNPRMSVRTSIGDGLAAARRFGNATSDTVESLLDAVSLPPEVAERRPRQLSGGQRQRVSIARALAVGAQTLVLDEPTSALDVTVQATILDLIERLATERGLGMLLISHNLAVVDRLCDRVIVLHDGTIVEQGPTETVLSAPKDAYTAALRDAVPHLAYRPHKPA